MFVYCHMPSLTKRLAAAPEYESSGKPLLREVAFATATTCAALLKAGDVTAVCRTSAFMAEEILLHRVVFNLFSM